jgi:hypothetical protein
MVATAVPNGQNSGSFVMTWSSFRVIPDSFGQSNDCESDIENREVTINQLPSLLELPYSKIVEGSLEIARGLSL